MRSKNLYSILVVSLLLTSILLLCSVTAQAGIFNNIRDKIHEKTNQVIEDIRENILEPIKESAGELDDSVIDNILDGTDRLDEERKLSVFHAEEVEEGENFIVQVADHEGNPVSGAKIYFRGKEEFVYKTNEEGIVNLTALNVTEDETHWLVVAKLSKVSVGVSKVEIINVDTSLQIMAPTAVQSGEEFQVTVLNGENKTIENVTVSFEGSEPNETTNRNGSVTFSAPDVAHPHAEKITASKEGFESASENITVEPKEKGFFGFLVGNMLLISIILTIIGVAVVAAWKYKQHFWY